jgi:hypothetical protein
MKYAIVKTINGAYFIDSEGFTDVDKAKVKFHGVCQAMWNAEDVVTASVAIVDENLDVVQGYKEFISHVVEPNE